MRSLRHLEQWHLLPYLGRWLLISLIVAGLAGTASALFLHALDWATTTRTTHRWLLWLLPVAGFAVGWIYLRIGRQVEAGNNLIIDEIHDPQKVLPLRLAPLVLGGTVISHLFGASVGREGTAVQMGAALGDQLTRLLQLRGEQRRILLMTGMSAGFASVFGTPIAGAVFGLEILAIGRLRYDAILPCFIAAILANQVGLLWGVNHSHYSIPSIPSLTAWGFCATVLAGIVFGFAGMLFADATHALAALMKRRITYAPLRPLLGGTVVTLAVMATGTDRYIGLGIATMQEAFQHPLPFWDWIGKAGFTIVSLGAGFKGGEVTPLFYIGATLGNALAPLLHLPFALLAGLGFVGVFAGAANTPLASTLLALELFGSEIGVYAAIACVVSYLFSGQSGIYRAQRVGHKHRPLPEHLRLGELPAYQRRLQETTESRSTEPADTQR